MGKVRVRRETGKLVMDFMYQGIRCREQTSLMDTAGNRKKVEALLARIEAKILLGDFDYASQFPNSANLAKFNASNELHCPQVVAIHQNPSTTVTPTMADFSEQWFMEMQVQWRRSHLRNIRSLLDGSLIPALGKKTVGQITKGDLMAYRAQEAKRPGRNGNSTLSPKTLNTRMGVVKVILDEAAERFGFESPYKNIKPLKLKKSHIEPFSLEEVRLICQKVRPDYQNYYLVRFYTGMRTGEIDGLKWSNINFENREILIRQTLINGETEYTKTDGSQREIPMLGPVYDALRQQYQATARISEYVFCNRTGLPLDHNNVTKRVWYPLLRQLNLKKRRPYQTRHTTATLLLAVGENPEWVARILGHASTEMLFKVYSRYIPNLTRMDGSAIERLLTSTTSNKKELSDETA